VEVDLTLNSINMKNTTITNGVTTIYDIDLSRSYIVEYALNTSVLVKVRHVEESVLNYNRTYTEYELELVAQNNSKKHHTPLVVLNDNSKLLVLEFDFYENHWILLNGIMRTKKLKELGLDLDMTEEVNHDV
jgi:hypothetical protein